METAVAQVLAMKGSEGGHQLAARIMAILGKYLAPVLETGRVPEAAMLVSAFGGQLRIPSWLALEQSLLC